MPEKLILDDGIIELEINGKGVLRFNPSDFNLYQRFCKFAQGLPEIEKQYRSAVETDTSDDPAAAAKAKLDRLGEIDAELKSGLSAVFGAENDFDALLGGVSLLACGSDGRFVITNLMEALMPYLKTGARKHMSDAAEMAVAEAKKNRAQRRGGK